MSRRLAGPVGFLLVAVCLFLPFVTGSCSGEWEEVPEQARQRWRVTHTGVDLLVGGQPRVEWGDDRSEGRLQPLDQERLINMIGQPPPPLPPQPLAWVALGLLATAVVVTAVRPARWSGIAAGAAAMGAAAALYAAALRAREHAIEVTAGVLRRAVSTSLEPPSTPVEGWEYYPWVRDQFHLDYGLWTAIGTLLVVGGVTVAFAVVRPRILTASAPPTGPDG